jgi:alpha-amylase
LKTDLNQLLFARKTYLGGTLNVLSETGNPWPAADVSDVYVARRQGNGTKNGAIVVINDHESATKSLWVNSSPAGYQNWAGLTLVNAFNPAQTTVVQADGRVNVSAPPRGYTIWVRQSEYVAYTTPSSTARIAEPEEETVQVHDEITETDQVNVFPNPADQHITLSPGIKSRAPYTVSIFNNAGTLVYRKEIRNTSDRFELATGQWKNGMYIVKVKSGKRTTSTRVYVNH